MTSDGTKNFFIHKISVFTLLAHISDTLQLLDISVFGPLKYNAMKKVDAYSKHLRVECMDWVVASYLEVH